jgi:hypothetical protein
MQALDDASRIQYASHILRILEALMVTPKDKIVRTTLALPDSLLYQLKVAAAEERTNVGQLLNRIAEDWLKTRKGGRR